MKRGNFLYPFLRPFAFVIVIAFLMLNTMVGVPISNVQAQGTPTKK